MLRAVGFRDEDFAKPIIGVASTWSMVTPCNMHIDRARARTAGPAIDAAGGKSASFSAPSRCRTGSAWAPPGMRYSMVSREVIADSIETVSGAESFDAVVAIGGCDKDMPGLHDGAGPRSIALGVFVYGGTILPGILSVRAGMRHRFGLRGRGPARRETNSTMQGCMDVEDPCDAPAPAPAAVCIPPIRWPRRSRPWA